MEQIVFADDTLWLPEDVLNYIEHNIPLPVMDTAESTADIALLKQEICQFQPRATLMMRTMPGWLYRWLPRKRRRKTGEQPLAISGAALCHRMIIYGRAAADCPLPRYGGEYPRPA